MHAYFILSVSIQLPNPQELAPFLPFLGIPPVANPRYLPLTTHRFPNH